MSKDEKISELRRLVIPFFETDNLSQANAIKETIYKEVLSFKYPEGSSDLIENSLNVWKRDISNYLTVMEESLPDKLIKHHAFLAWQGIINLISFAEES